jgi:hypothetical protein
LRIVYVPEANLLAGAFLCPGAGLLPVLRGDDAVIVPGIADVLHQSREHFLFLFSLTTDLYAYRQRTPATPNLRVMIDIERPLS